LARSWALARWFEKLVSRAMLASSQRPASSRQVLFWMQ